MLLILSKDFVKNRDTVKKSTLALIQETIDNINSQRIDKSKPEEELVAALNDDNFDWSKYNKKHKVAVLFQSKPNPQWYYSKDAGMFIVECYYPEKVVTWAEGYPEFYYALEIAVNFDYYKALGEKAKDINYQIVRSKDDPLFQRVINDKNLQLLGCDIETRGFSWKKDKMLVHGFAYEDNEVMIIPQHELEKDPEFLMQFKTFVENPEKIFVWQNGKFDTKFYRYAGWDARVDEDTMLQSYALDERGGRHGLEYQATKILNTDGYKHKIKFETVSPDDPDLHYYLAQDCIYTRLIHKHH
ncbi:MAG: ribonuclease H-like domain-containing protein, partial [Cetobacterium sp.]